MVTVDDLQFGIYGTRSSPRRATPTDEHLPDEHFSAPGAGNQ